MNSFLKLRWIPPSRSGKGSKRESQLASVLEKSVANVAAPAALKVERRMASKWKLIPWRDTASFSAGVEQFAHFCWEDLFIVPSAIARVVGSVVTEMEPAPRSSQEKRASTLELGISWRRRSKSGRRFAEQWASNTSATSLHYNQPRYCPTPWATELNLEKAVEINERTTPPPWN